MPTESQLWHIGITGEQLATTDQSTAENVNTPITTCIRILGAGLPPVPANLVSKIESGAFIEKANCCLNSSVHIIPTKNLRQGQRSSVLQI